MIYAEGRTVHAHDERPAQVTRRRSFVMADRNDAGSLGWILDQIKPPAQSFAEHVADLDKVKERHARSGVKLDQHVHVARGP